jgi:hypothetical protein
MSPRPRQQAAGICSVTLISSVSGQRLATLARSIQGSATMRRCISARLALKKPRSSSSPMAASICSALTRSNGPSTAIVRIGRSSSAALSS